MISYRKYTRKDFKHICMLQLKELDKLEAKALLRVSPLAALTSSIYLSKDNVWVVELDGNIEAVFGVCSGMTKGSGQPWYMSTEMERNFPRMKFLRTSKKIIDEMLEIYPKLSNYVLVARTKTIKWLRWLGFTVDKRNYYFADPNVPFREFYLERGDND
jgi:hypothetical protein